MTDEYRGAGRVVAWVALLAWVLLACPVRADDVAAQGRQVVDRWQGAVVTVRLVLKMTMSMAGSEGEQEESKADATGTVIDPSGLTVISLSQLDPAASYNRMMRQRSPGEPSFNVESQITDAKLRLADGTEVAAKVVLRDNDLDLAFLRPVEKLPQPVAAIDLSQSTAPRLLEQVVTINRLGNAADWAIAPRIDRIQALIAKPRLTYVPQDADDLGTPAFSLDGKVVGVTVLRLSAAGATDDVDAVAIIMPAADILQVAKQAGE
jgi:hypothetical protein